MRLLPPVVVLVSCYWVAMLLVGGLMGTGAPARGHEPGVPHDHEHSHSTTTGGDADARWWKGNLHTHTLWSDGDEFPEIVADWYREHGYNFLGLSDHNVLSAGQRWMKLADIEKRGGAEMLDNYRRRYGGDWVEVRGSGEDTEVRLKPLDEFRTLVEERQRFLMIPAEEVTNGHDHGDVHIGTVNVQEVIVPLPGATVVETLNNTFRQLHEQAERAGREMFAHLNHPNYKWAITAEDLAQMVLERHFEIYNGHPGTNQRGDDLRPSTDRLWDIANTIRLVDLNVPPLLGVANDDSHEYHGEPNKSHPGRGWVMVRSQYLSPEHIVRAIKAGDYYASSGVRLKDVRYDADKRMLSLDIEPQEGATYTTEFIGTQRGTRTDSQPVTDPDNPTLRVTGKYSDQIGAVFKTVEGVHAEYQLTGDELYVRAVVTSTLPPVDPSFEGQRQQAWTQPVGWTISPDAAAGQ